VVAVVELDLRLVWDQFVPAPHAAVEGEARRQVGRFLDLLSRNELGVERVPVLDDEGDPDG